MYQSFQAIWPVSLAFVVHVIFATATRKGTNASLAIFTNGARLNSGVPPAPDVFTGTYSCPTAPEVTASAVLIAVVLPVTPRASVVAVAPRAEVTWPRIPVTRTAPPATVYRLAVAVCGRFAAALVTRIPGVSLSLALTLDRRDCGRAVA